MSGAELQSNKGEVMAKKKRRRRLKVKNILIAVLIFTVLVASTAFLIFNSHKVQKLEVKEKITITIGQQVPKESDYIPGSITDNIQWDNIDIEDGKIYHSGVYEGKVLLDSELKNIKLVVLDQKKPVIECEDTISVPVGSKIDLFSLVNVTDDSHDDLEKKIDGKYDLNKAGFYDIEFNVIDKSGNRTSKKVRLQVKESNSTSGSKTNTSTNTKSNVTPTSSGSKLEGTTPKGFKIEKKDGVYYIGGILIANKTYSLPSDYNPGSLLSEFNIAFTQMKEAAEKEGIDLKVVSGFRSYSTQNTLYNNYVSRDGKAEADRYSARPGYSEHQTGLAADLNEVSDTFGETKAGKWLSENCWRYGFILRYPKGKESITGYMYESWHFRYIGDTNIAKELYNDGDWSTLEEYLGIDSVYK